MIKLLKNVEPSIRAYLGDAFCFSIIDDKAFDSGWVYDKYIHLEYTSQDGHIKYTDYDYYDFVPDQGVFIKSFTEYPCEYCTPKILIEQITQMLDNDEYCFALWDETIITNYLYGECIKDRYEHGCFIYGYDSEKRIFYTEGYFDNEKWEHYTVPYDVFYKAVSYGPEKGEIALIGYKEIENYDWKVDEEKAKKEMEVYVKNSLSQDDVCYLDLNAIYNFFVNLRPGSQVHYPSLYCMYEHKKIFWRRLNYFAEDGWSIDSAVLDLSKDLMKEYRKIMLLGLAYNESLEMSLFNQMRNKAKMVIEKERLMIQKIHT